MALSGYMNLAKVPMKLLTEVLQLNVKSFLLLDQFVLEFFDLKLGFILVLSFQVLVIFILWFNNLLKFLDF